jgi:hypothetical protein
MLRSERGDMALTQLLMAMAVFGGVLGSTLFIFQNFVTVSADTTQRAADQDKARFALDALARELRNLASPTQEQPQAVDKVSPFDIVFQTVDPVGPNTGLNASNSKRVRYCLNVTSPSDGKLWFQEQRWTTQAAPAVPSTAACPGTGWTAQRLVADHITNARNNLNRPLFVANSSTLTDVSSLHADLLVDSDPAKAPTETRITTGVFLRNQNRRPIASFTATPTASGILLNGSASYDPEGEQLSYVWFDGATKVGSGITFTYPAAAGTSHTMSLKVYDPASLEGVAASQVVVA